MGFVVEYTKTLDKIKIPVIIFWVLLFGVSCYFGPKFLSRTTNAFTPPSDSDASHAEDLMAQAFPAQSKVSSAMVIYISSSDNSSLLGNGFKNFSLGINSSMYLFPTCNNSCIQQFAGYYIFEQLKFPPEASLPFMANKNRSSILPLVANYPFTSDEALNFAQYLEKEMKRLKPVNASWNMELLGIPAFIPVMQASIERDFALMDGIVLPLALIVLAIILKSFRLLILPLVGMGVSALVSFCGLFFVSYAMQIISFAPSLMMSLMVAMSIDYSLFLLSRFREELLEENLVHDAVEQMIATAGHTIVVSGITLAACFLGLVVLPLNLMQSLGVACSLTIIVMLLVNLTLIPSLLLTFPNFFARCVNTFFFCGYPITYGSKDSLVDDMMSINNPINEETHVFVSKVQVTVDSPFWYKFGNYMLTPPINFVVLLFVLLLLIPFGFYVYPYATSDDIDMTLPSGTNSTNAYLRMIEQFGYGPMYPYRMLITPKSGGVLNQTFLDNIVTIVTRLAAQVPNTTKENFAGFSYVKGTSISLFDIELCLSIPGNSIPSCNGLKYAFQSFVNPTRNATFMEISLDFNPIGSFGDVWYLTAKNVSRHLERELNLTISFTGIGASSMDAVDFVNNNFLTMVLITGGVVLAFVAIAFRSIILPFRSVLTIGMTILWVYGFADLVYEHGVLDWLHFRGLQGYGAIHWAPPIISFSIIVGIALDYDIFLLVRIKEFRDSGYSTKESIALGISKTGHIITAAGVIMAIAFCGLLFSSVAVMNMLSFYMVFAVLFDTFIVRSIVVPALMGMLGDLNWWPGRVPEVRVQYNSEPYSNE